MNKPTPEMLVAMKKDVDGLKAAWLAAGTMADRELADHAVASFKAYVDTLHAVGVSLAVL